MGWASSLYGVRVRVGPDFRPEGWLRWFAHLFGGIWCRVLAQYLAFAPKTWLCSQLFRSGSCFFWPFCILLPQICLNCACSQFLFGLPRWHSGKNLPANLGDARDASLIPGSGRSPIGVNGNPFQYSCLESSMDRGAWRAIVHGFAKSQPNWVTDLVPYSFFTFHCLRRHLSRCKHCSKMSQVSGPNLSQKHFVSGKHCKI